MNKLAAEGGRHRVLLWTLLMTLLLAACTTSGTASIHKDKVGSVDGDESPTTPSEASTRLPASRYDEYQIVTLLPRDAIPAIDRPEFVDAAEADISYDPDELVIGVEFGDESRAYSVPFLSRHEIVNDTVAGVKIAVTW